MELNETEPQFCSRQTEPDLRCYYHPEREATNQCDRCGDYLCDDCVRTLAGEYVCTTCYDRHFGDRTWRDMGGAAAEVAFRVLWVIAIILALVFLRACLYDL